MRKCASVCERVRACVHARVCERACACVRAHRAPLKQNSAAPTALLPPQGFLQASARRRHHLWRGPEQRRIGRRRRPPRGASPSGQEAGAAGQQVGARASGLPAGCCLPSRLSLLLGSARLTLQLSRGLHAARPATSRGVAGAGRAEARTRQQGTELSSGTFSDAGSLRINVRPSPSHGERGPRGVSRPRGARGAWITVRAASRVTEGRRDSQGQRCDPVGVGAVARALSLVLGVGAGAGRGREGGTVLHREPRTGQGWRGLRVPQAASLPGSGEASFKALQVQSSGSRSQY